MRISVVGQFPPQPGGISAHSQELVEALRRDGHTVKTYGWRSMYPRALYPGRSVRGTAEGSLLQWWNPFSWFRVGRLVRDSDLVVIPYVHPFHAISLGTVARRTGDTPTVCLAHNFIPHDPFPFSTQLGRWALRPFDACVVHSEFVARSIGAVLPGLPITVVGIPPSVAIEPTPVPPRPPFRLLFLGYVRPYKGLDIGIRAIRAVVDQGYEVHLTVAGEFWESIDDYQKLVLDLDLGDSVQFAPEYVPDDEVSSLLASCHALLAPYRSATQSGVVPLALAAGRPVVVTNVGGLSEQVTDGVDGTVADPEVGAVADAIVRVIDGYESFRPRVSETHSSWQGVVEAVVGATSGAG